MKTILAVLSLALLPSLALATPADLKKLKAAGVEESKNASCKSCHTKGKELNEYGHAYKEADRDFSKMKK